MATSVKVKWVLPTERESGRPLPTSEIKHVKIEISADAGANFSRIGEFPPEQLEVLVPDLEDGTWMFRSTVVDTKDRASSETTAEVTLGEPPPEDDTPPRPVKELSIEVLP